MGQLITQNQSTQNSLTDRPVTYHRIERILSPSLYQLNALDIYQNNLPRESQQSAQFFRIDCYA